VGRQRVGTQRPVPHDAVTAMVKALLAGALLAVAAAAGAREAGEVTPLFRDEAPIEMTITGPIRRITSRAAYATDAYPATIIADGETHAIDLSARGISRRERGKCSFPPLRIKLKGKAGAASLFHRQRGIKLVTHCNAAEPYEQYLLREYAAYRLYNVLTPESFRVRLVRVTYVDDGKPLAPKWGFFIEDADDAARRLGLRELTIEKIERRALDPRALARFALFQYMIGNTDWDVTTGPAGSDCCHNVKLLSADQQSPTGIIPLPYDFDNSGLVAAPYAVPNEALPIYDVRTRLYRGYCATNLLARTQAETFVQARPALEAVLGTIPGLSAMSRRAMLTYLDPFFSTIASPEPLQRQLLSKCQ
jgi:hypothetical protein